MATPRLSSSRLATARSSNSARRSPGKRPDDLATAAAGSVHRRSYAAAMAAHVVQLSRSRGGVPKLAVEEAVVTTNGLAGDRQRDRRFHGGPNRALCLYSDDLIEQLALEGHPIVRGSAGENVTIRGLDWRTV